MAYYEALDIVKNEFAAREIDLRSVGLDADLEKLFFR